MTTLGQNCMTIYTGADLLDIDYKTDLEEIRRICSGKVAVRGTIDPSEVMCFSPPEVVKKKCREAIEVLAPGGGFMLSSGCDIMKQTPAENMQAMVEATIEHG